MKSSIWIFVADVCLKKDSNFYVRVIDVEISLIKYLLRQSYFNKDIEKIISLLKSSAILVHLFWDSLVLLVLCHETLLDIYTYV